MELTDDDISKLDHIYRNTLGIELPRDILIDRAHTILELVSILSNPVTIDEFERLKKYISPEIIELDIPAT